MYSLLPALVSALYLGYGAYVVGEKGLNHISISISFLLLCLTSFVWQASWAVLFQVDDVAYVDPLIRFGYLFIIFLPTTLYHFSVEMSGATRERRWIYVSYAIAAVLAAFDIFSDWFVNGYYHYFFGYYPKAGVLHPVHVLQTTVLAALSFHVIWRNAKVATEHQKARLRLCMVSVLVYVLAAVDYLCNYGLAFYPPGAIFTTISLGLMVMVMTRHELTSSVTVAATMAHEIRTPLVSIRMLADGLVKHLPELHKGYKLAVEHGLMKANIRPAAVQLLADLSHNISYHITHSNTIIDMMLAHARMERIDTSHFAWHSMHACVTEALAAYPFEPNSREKVHVVVDKDFQFFGTPELMTLVLFNLTKNALYALKVAEKGDITITLSASEEKSTLSFTDTGCGIAAQALPHIFDTFFTTKKSSGHGLGLAFCRRVMAACNAQMYCHSVEKQYTPLPWFFHPCVHESASARLPRAART